MLGAPVAAAPYGISNDVQFFYNPYTKRNFQSDPFRRKRRRPHAHLFVQMQEMRPPIPGNPLLQGVRGREEEMPEVREPQRRADPRDVFRQDIEESVTPRSQDLKIFSPPALRQREHRPVVASDGEACSPEGRHRPVQNILNISPVTADRFISSWELPVTEAKIGSERI